MTDSDAGLESGTHRPVPCPECEFGELLVADGVYAECDNCDAAVERREAGI